VPWAGPPPEDFKNAFREKYVFTKRYLSEKTIVSELSIEKTTYWSSEEDYLSFVTDEDPRISKWLEEYYLQKNRNKFSEDIVCYEEEDNLYKQPHIFVVFIPGSAGNFVSSMLESLTNNELNRISLSNIGHVHFNAVVERKKIGIDHISLGIGLAGIDPEFFSYVDKIKFYMEKIDSVNYENRPYVSWTHDFENIILYKVLFPNSKTLSITSYTLKERLISIIMGIRKNFFSTDDQLAISTNSRIIVKIIKKKVISVYFKKYYSNKKYVAGHNDLDLFLMLQAHLDVNKLNLGTDLSSVVPYSNDDFDGDLSYMKNKMQVPKGIENTELSTSKIRFSDILENNNKNLSLAFETLLERNLTAAELVYIEQSLNQYIKGQDQFVLTDPVGYINSLKEKADLIVSSFENV
jgi:hypothetical protein